VRSQIVFVGISLDDRNPFGRCGGGKGSLAIYRRSQRQKPSPRGTLSWISSSIRRSVGRRIDVVRFEDCEGTPLGNIVCLISLADTAARDRSPPGLPTMVAGDPARGLVISPTDEAQQEEILVSRYRKFLVKKNEDLSFFDL
jgi:hypothetical protein